MAMNRSLGEGKITKLFKKYAYIDDDRLGQVFFPLTAALISSPGVIDLRDNFQINEFVVFTASKQPQVNNNNECQYVASSVVKRNELIRVNAKIIDVLNGYCLAEVKRYGRVFVPFSARTDLNKAWLGKGAEKGKDITLKIFRQPDINQCKFVAWGIVDSDDMQRCTYTAKGAEKQPDVAAKQIGVIVSSSLTSDSLIYSATTGTCRLPVSLHRSWMCKGRFVQYDAIKSLCTLGTLKVNWCARNIVDLGMLYPLEEDLMDETRLILNLHAVVNRVSTENRNVWLWNDFVGRIYIPPQQYVRGLHPFNCVKVTILWTNAFDDVPWSAQAVENLGDNDELRTDNSGLLMTNDEWTVKYVSNQNQSTYGFMDNPKYGSAFVAWTDFSEGEVPLTVGHKCRATVYHQLKDKKHAWRAVLATPLDDTGEPMAYHPFHVHTGERHLPEAVEPPHMDPSPPPPAYSAVPRAHIPPPIAAPSQNGRQNGNSYGSFSSERDRAEEGNAFNFSETFGLGGLNIDTMNDSTYHPSPESLSTPSVGSSAPQRQTFADCVAKSTNPTLDLSMFNLLPNQSDFIPWRTTLDHSSSLTDFAPAPVSSTPTGRSSSSKNGEIGSSLVDSFSMAKSQKDAETQTDVFIEQEILKDIINNEELFNAVVSKLQSPNRIFQMSAHWKKI